jgi:hypothetical protein
MTKHEDGSVSYEPYEKISTKEWFRTILELLVITPLIFYTLWKTRKS